MGSYLDLIPGASMAIQGIFNRYAIEDPLISSLWRTFVDPASGALKLDVGVEWGLYYWKSHLFARFLAFTCEIRS